MHPLVRAGGGRHGSLMSGPAGPSHHQAPGRVHRRLAHSIKIESSELRQDFPAGIGPSVPVQGLLCSSSSSLPQQLPRWLLIRTRRTISVSIVRAISALPLAHCLPPFLPPPVLAVSLTHVMQFSTTRTHSLCLVYRILGYLAVRLGNASSFATFLTPHFQ